jgi:hypothetical protein
MTFGILTNNRAMFVPESFSNDFLLTFLASLSYDQAIDWYSGKGDLCCCFLCRSELTHLCPTPVL